MRTMGETINNNRRKFVVFFLFFIIAIAGIISIYIYINYKKTRITTDDAFVTGRIHVVASKIHGTVKALHVRDNQFAKKDQLLVEIDDTDYTVRLMRAKSVLDAENAKLSELSTKIEVVEKQLSELRFSIKSARANLKLREAQFKQAKTDLTRARRLFKKEIMPEEQYEKVMTGYDVGAAHLEVAKDQLKQVEASLETHRSFMNI
ncbi:MAG: biotin/lipoyl-binding protein [Syntrophales bacterium]|nr:biotin/lipoyl-binding protein [Syntrophales bacterium]